MPVEAGCCMDAVAHRSQKRVLGPLELELQVQAVVNSPVWVLVPELGLSEQ